MLAQRREQYTRANRSQRKKQTKLRRKKKQEQEQETAGKSVEHAECGPKSNPREQNSKPKADRQVKTEPRESSHSNEQSDQSSMSED